jgi:hypothetical protein
MTFSQKDLSASHLTRVTVSFDLSNNPGAGPDFSKTIGLHPA